MSLKFFIIVLFLFPIKSLAQNKQEQSTAYNNYYYSYLDGEYFKAKNYLEPFLRINPDSLFFSQKDIYHNLGIVSRRLGQNEKSLYFLSMSEKFCDPPTISPYHLVLNYNSRANIYRSLNDFQQSTLFFEKAINILNNYGNNSKKHYEYLSMLYLNYGILNYKRKEYDFANTYLEKSLKLKQQYGYNYLYSVYLNLAKVADRTNNYDQAEKLYKLAIKTIIDKYGKEYFLLNDLYLEFGELLIQTKKFEKAEVYIRKSLDLSLKSLSVHHSESAAGYHTLGDIYNAQEKFEKALEYYQIALNSIHPGLSSIDPMLNPPVEGSLNDIRYIEILNSKGLALYSQSLIEQNIEKSHEFLTIALNTIQLAINVKSNVQNSFPSQESKMYLSENEKELYVNGINYAIALNELEKDEKHKELAYHFASLYKATELKKTIYSRQAINLLEVQDSLYGELNIVQQSIRQYSNFLIQEKSMSKPDSLKISTWNNELFSLNRTYDSLQTQAQTKAWYNKINKEPEILSPGQIQSKLKYNQSLIDYVLFFNEADSSRVVYSFVITKNDFHISKLELDKEFDNSLDYYLSSLSKRPEYNTSLSSYDSLKHASYNIYSKLVHPIKDVLKGKELIIIPDEELLILPFESLITQYSEESIINFSGLPYLINDYCISYAFSGSLAFQDKNLKSYKPRVRAFAPGIGNISDLDNLVLEKSRDEINAVANLFPGEYFYDSVATKSKFLQNNTGNNIYHFAMHSNRELITESEGYLEFYPDEAENKLWGYEISFLDIESPLIVLSGCNTGLGLINKAEGVFSLSRNFLEAGAQSVIQTLWTVDDGSSSAIMQEFYKYLAKGRKKNISLYRAKMEYLETATPFFSHPYYWSGIQLLGNSEALMKAKWQRNIAIGVFLLVVVSIYFGRRRSFRKRSLASD